MYRSQTLPHTRASTYQELVGDLMKALVAHDEAAGDGGDDDGRQQRQYWVAVVGAPASGKSTTTREVARRLAEDKGVPTTVIPMCV
jgi:pantothenate kinase